jgi:hypothetical protein
VPGAGRSALRVVVLGGPCRARTALESWSERLAKRGHTGVFPILEGGVWRSPALIHKISQILHKVAGSGESGGKKEN